MRTWVVLLGIAACAGARPMPEAPQQQEKALELDLQQPWLDPDVHRPVARTKRQPSRTTPPAIVIRHATLLGTDRGRVENATLVMQDGLIRALGAEVPAPPGALEIDAKGRFVTPGLIDSHSHIGVAPSPSVEANQDVNEETAPITGAASAEAAYWPQDPAITRALAGGVTTAMILPGSANLVGGRGVVVEMRPGRVIDDVRLADAPNVVKMACGENPKRVHGDKEGMNTRMAMYETLRAAFAEALEYKVAMDVWKAKRADWERRRARARELEKAARRRGSSGFVKGEEAPERPKYDPKLDALARILRGEVLVQIHCYRASDIQQMVKIADEFGFQIRSFHHALEAYKVRALLIQRGIAINTWADWWGFKMEAFDGIPENAALYSESGGRVVIHSDSAIDIQHLNQEAAKAMHAGRAAGIGISEDEALRWVTANPAWVLGIDDKTGTLAPGKRADVVIWDKHPFSVYARADQVFIGGESVYDRKSRGMMPTDFELGNSSLETPTP